MNQSQNVKDIIVAINSVKSRAKKSLAFGNLHEYNSLMHDLLALERCLVYQTEAMIREVA